MILLARFAAAVHANDGPGLAALFTTDGVYDDGFFGPHRGREAIAAMLARFHQGGRDYWWEFLEPVRQGATIYAHWRFSYASLLPGLEGRPVLFEGMSQFRLEGERIALYREIFDRGLALSQLGFAPERIARISRRAAEAQNAKPASAPHLRRFGAAPRDA